MNGTPMCSQCHVNEVDEAGRICGDCQRRNTKLLENVTKKESSREASRKRAQDFTKGGKGGKKK